MSSVRRVGNEDDVVFVTRESLVHVDHKEYDEINILYAEMKRNHRYFVEWEGIMMRITYDGTVMVVSEVLENFTQINGKYMDLMESPVVVLKADHFMMNIDKMEIDHSYKRLFGEQPVLVTRKDSRWITIHEVQEV